MSEKPLKHIAVECLEIARNGRLCAGAKLAAAEIERLQSELKTARATNEMKQPHWTCKTHGDFDATVAVGCPECVRTMRVEIEQLRKALRFYGKEAAWSSTVIDSYGGEVTLFDWDGDVQDEPWEVAERALQTKAPAIIGREPCAVCEETLARISTMTKIPGTIISCRECFRQLYPETTKNS